MLYIEPHFAHWRVRVVCHRGKDRDSSTIIIWINANENNFFLFTSTLNLFLVFHCRVQIPTFVLSNTPLVFRFLLGFNKRVTATPPAQSLLSLVNHSFWLTTAVSRSQTPPIRLSPNWMMDGSTPSPKKSAALTNATVVPAPSLSLV